MNRSCADTAEESRQAALKGMEEMSESYKAKDEKMYLPRVIDFR